jgi:hypothetical protein
MVFYPPRLNVPLLIVAMGAMVLSAGAQSSDRSIIFSTPKFDDTATVTPSLAPESSQLPILPDSLQAPDPSLHFQAPNDLPVAPPAVANTPHSQRMNQLLEDRKNWALMTPEQILGTTPTDELLPATERDAMGPKKNATQLDRYLDRENNLRGSYTNSWQNNRDNSPWNLSRDRDGLNPSDPGRDSPMDAAQRLNEYLNSRRIGDGPANRNDKSFGWDAFNPPVPQTPDKPDVEQMAAMDRFRQLLNPSPATATEPSPESKFFPVPKTAPVLDPYITQPDYMPNPAGASFKPLTTGIGKPTGLTPLPGIVNQGIAPVTAPAWAPQPAPWLIQGPQPFVMPQRKF